MSNTKKTLFFAIEDNVTLSKTLEKSIVVDNAPIDCVLPKQAGKKFNIINIKVIPEDDAVLALDIDELETFLDEQAQELSTAIFKKYPKAISMTGDQVDAVVEFVENAREERLTSNLTDIEKMARASMVEFVKKHNITGTTASYLKNLFRDISSLNLITEDSPIGNQKKSLRSVFPDRRDLLDLSIHQIEEAQTKIADFINSKDLSSLNEVKETFELVYQATWPQVGPKEKTALEIAAEEVAAEQKNKRGRPKKHKF